MRLFLSVTLVITSFLLMTACQKDPGLGGSGTDSSGTNPVSGSLQARINGVQWVADKEAAARRGQGLITISGFSTDKKYLSITLTDSGIHRYILSDATLNAAAYTDSAEANKVAYTTRQGNYPANTGGEVTISAIDTVKKTISGKFSFKVFRESDGVGKIFTEGRFTELPYTITLPPPAVTDTFQVKVDNGSLIPSTITGAAIALTNQIAITATNATATKAVGLLFPATIVPGSYAFSLFGGTYVGQYNPDSNPANARASVSGTLTILEHDMASKRIRGTFFFRGEELLNAQNFSLISDGYFSVKYR